jgi:hypothetical protein
MRRAVLAAAALAVLSAGPAKAGDVPDNQTRIRGCITAAAKVHRLPPAVLVILLNVEGGSLGRVSPNTNGTVDIGPIQVNEVWLPEVAAHWHATITDAYKAMRDNFCANVEAGAWILRRGLDEARGDFWEGVGYYHSHTPEHKTRYLRDVLRQVVHLRTLVEHAVTSAPPNVVQVTAPPLAPERRPSD